MTNHLFGEVRSRIPSPDASFAELDDGRRYSYADMLDVSARFANVLVDLGVKPGDRVAVQVEKSIEALMLYLAVVRAGAVFLPLNTAYTPTEIDYFLGDAEPTVFVCDPAGADALRPSADRVDATLETLGIWHSHDVSAGSLADKGLAASTDFADVPREAGDLAAILYTSGTTGRSKGAMLSHENLASNARVLVDAWRFSRNDVLIHALPIFHTHGLFVATNVVLFSGASMLFRTKFDADDVLRRLPKATTLMGVPTFYTRLLQHPGLTRDATTHMRLFVSGSAPLLAETHAEFAARTGHAILERYGMTETNMNTSNPYDGARVAGTVGLPLAGVEVVVTDPATGGALPHGEIGMIEVRGPNVFKGYWRKPEKTAEELRPNGFFITGDLGRIDADGYLSIVGRGKDLIITGGFNVYPKEVETEIDLIEGVVESAVIGLPHKDFGEGVTAVVVARSDAALNEAGIQAHLAARLARFKLPKRVLFVDDLPRNTMGKVQKAQMRQTYAGLYDEATARASR